MAEVTLAGLVKEGVSDVGCVARDLLPGEVLAVDTVAAQMAPLDAGFATLDPCHLGDLGKSSCLGGSSPSHPGGPTATGSGDCSWFCHSTVRKKRETVTVIHAKKERSSRTGTKIATFLTSRCLTG